MPAPNDINWWQQPQVSPGQQRNWWQNRLVAMPYANGNIQDNLAQAPSIPGIQPLGFDRLMMHPDSLAMRGAQPVQAPGQGGG